MRLCRLGPAEEVRQPRREAVAPAKILDVALLSGQPHTLLDQAASLLELSEARDKQALEGVAEGIGAADGDTRPHRGVAVRQLDGPVESRQGLRILADAK